MAEFLLTRGEVAAIRKDGRPITGQSIGDVFHTLEAAFADLRLLMEATAHCPEDMVRTLAALRVRIHDRWDGTGWLDEEKP